ncbi:MAG: signal peptidase I [Propionibacteriaceae bacterium]|jgi:signal peptidase I|nr:signal peptidase I [Propionibacteriaceae bacterium]
MPLSALEPTLSQGSSGWAVWSEARPRRAIEEKPRSVRGSAGPRRGLDPAEAAPAASPEVVSDRSGGEPPPPPPRPSAWRSAFRLVREGLIILVVAVIISTLIRTFGVEQFRVPTGSMEQTLYGVHTDASGKTLSGDRIFVAKLAHYERGDIIVFEDKLGWLADSGETTSWFKRPLELIGLLPDSSKRYLVKRLIGLPGDHVTCCSASGQLSVNGVELDEPYLYTMPDGSKVNASDYPFDIVVPAGHVFVLGDHRNGSSDSRFHLCAGATQTPELGFPSVDDIEGPVVAIAWPWSRMTTFHTPEVFADVPDPTGDPPETAEISQYPSC